MSEEIKIVEIETRSIALFQVYEMSSVKFKNCLSILRNDVFVHGYQGECFKESFDSFERARIVKCLESVERLFNFCHISKNKTAWDSNAMINLSEIFSSLDNTKYEDERFTDMELLWECFAITEFWKFLATEGRNEYDITIAVLNFHEWLESIIEYLRPLSL